MFFSQTRRTMYFHKHYSYKLYVYYLKKKKTHTHTVRFMYKIHFIYEKEVQIINNVIAVGSDGNEIIDKDSLI